MYKWPVRDYLVAFWPMVGVFAILIPPLGGQSDHLVLEPFGE